MIKYTIDKNQAIIFEGRTLYRIKALRNFADVIKGDYGGYIQNYRNLSQDGTCWIYDDAKVLDKGSVNQSATVYHNAIVRDYAKIERTALIENNAIISQHAIVTGLANICGNAQVKGNSLIMDSVHVFGKTKLEGSLHLINDAIISSSNDVFGFNDVYQNRYLTYTTSNQTWVADTVIGNHQDLLDSATSDKAKTIYQHYIAIIENSEK